MTVRLPAVHRADEPAKVSHADDDVDEFLAACREQSGAFADSARLVAEKLREARVEVRRALVLLEPALEEPEEDPVWKVLQEIARGVAGVRRAQ